MWMARAEDDLFMAETVAAGSGPPWGTCYHVQQAVEKASKALIVAADEDPPRTHNLARLNIAVEPAMFEGEDDDMLASLTLWAFQQRDPADQPEPTAADAQAALAFGRRALHAAGSQLRG